MKSATLFSMTVILYTLALALHTIFSNHFDEDGWRLYNEEVIYIHTCIHTSMCDVRQKNQNTNLLC